MTKWRHYIMRDDHHQPHKFEKPFVNAKNADGGAERLFVFVIYKRNGFLDVSGEKKEMGIHGGGKAQKVIHEK
jgi:hypothetical protein